MYRPEYIKKKILQWMDLRIHDLALSIRLFGIIAEEHNLGARLI